MKFRCECNHIIRDQTDNLPYKAEFTLDKNLGHLYTYLSEIDSLIEAVLNKSEQEWINKNFSKDFPKLDKYSSYISDLITRLDTRNMYECTNCGRLHVKNNDDFNTYKLEHGKKGIFEL